MNVASVGDVKSSEVSAAAFSRIPQLLPALGPAVGARSAYKAETGWWGGSAVRNAQKRTCRYRQNASNKMDGQW